MDSTELEKVCCNLRSVAQSCKGGVPLNRLDYDYKALLGKPIPFTNFGHKSLESFISSFPKFVRLKTVNGSKIVEAVADKNTAHIASLISKQKSSKTGLVIKQPGKKSASVKKPAPILKPSNMKNPNSAVKYVPVKVQPKVSGSQEKNGIPSSSQNQTKMTNLEKVVCINLRAITLSSKGGVLVENLQNDYKRFVGGYIPYDILGYDSLEDFLETIPDVLRPVRNSSGKLVVEGVPDSTTAHISKLICKQKENNPVKKKPLKNKTVNQTNPQNSTMASKASQNQANSTNMNGLSVVDSNQGKKAAQLSNLSKPNDSSQSIRWSGKTLGSFPCIRDNITNGHFSTLMGLHNLLFGVSYMDTLKEKILNFGGYLFLQNTEEWKKRELLFSVLPENGLKEYLNLLCIRFDDTDDMHTLLNKLLNFIASVETEVIDPAKVGKITGDLDWYKKCQEKDDKLAEVMDENNKLKAEILRLKNESKSSNERLLTKTKKEETIINQSNELKNLKSKLEKVKEQRLESATKVTKIQKEKGQLEFQLNSLKHEMKAVEKQRKALVAYLSSLSTEKEKMKTYFLTELASISDCLYDLVDSFDDRKSFLEMKEDKNTLTDQTGKINSLKEQIEKL